MRARLGAATERRTIPPRAISALIARNSPLLQPAGPIFPECSAARVALSHRRRSSSAPCPTPSCPRVS
jgi:hypothetical protein